MGRLLDDLKNKHFRRIKKIRKVVGEQKRIRKIEKMILLLDNYKSALKIGNCGSLVNSLGIRSPYYIYEKMIYNYLMHVYI